MLQQNNNRKTASEVVLKGLRVLDFSWVLAGPYASLILADFGAEVIKVQPLLAESEDDFSRGYYETWNRNKLGISLNMEKDEGQTIARRLIALSDAVVENFSPRVMDNWGMDYPALRKIRPDIIYLRISTVGHSGPRQDFSGFGLTVQATSGLTSLTGHPGQPPAGMGFSVADHVGGLYAAISLLGALEYRQKTGQGQYIDLSLAETMTTLLADKILEYTHKPPIDLTCGASPQSIFRCRGEDSWVAITVNNDIEWERLKKTIGNPTLTDRSDLISSAARIQNSEVLDDYVQSWTQKHDAFEVMKILQAEGIAVGVVQNAADLAADPQLKARGFFVERAASSPIRLSACQVESSKPAPLKGRDNDYVYGKLLGYSSAEIENLKHDNVI